MKRARTVLLSGVTVLVVAGGLFAYGAASGGTADPDATSPSGSTGTTTATDPLSTSIANAQAVLRANPKDAGTWATLGLSYISQAKVKSDPSFYVKATGAVQMSLQLDSTDNYQGYASLAALKNAEHDFRAGAVAARKGIAIDKYDSTLFGALGDSLTQLGQYDAAAAAIDQMNQLLPGVAAFTRASYVFELRGDVPSSRAALQRALTDASSGSDRGFAEFYLGELDLHYGGAKGLQSALQHYRNGVADSPGEASLLAGLAKAEAAAGMTQQALRDYRTVVSEVPQPQYVLELGDLETSLGDPDAKNQYALFQTEEKLFVANGVKLDVDPTLFEADHGDPTRAVALGVSGWAARPFVEMADARGWALYRDKQYAQALTWSRRAFTSGWSPSLELFHRGMIEKALGMKAAAKADLSKALVQEPAFSPLQVPVAKNALAHL